MTIQKALLVPKKFADFVVGDTEKYKPGPGEILIKVQSAALNPADWKIRKFGVIVEEYPAVLGLDIAGDVEELGEGVTETCIGFAPASGTRTRAPSSSTHSHLLRLVVKGEEGKSIHRVLASLRIPPNIEILEALYQDKITGLNGVTTTAAQQI